MLTLKFIPQIEHLAFTLRQYKKITKSKASTRKTNNNQIKTNKMDDRKNRKIKNGSLKDR